MRRLKTSLLACAAFVAIAAPTLAQSLPQQNDSYFIAAAKHLQDMTARKPIDGPAKNVILFVGDGMSIPTVTAARIYEGQKRGVDGESNLLTIDTFPFVALSKTYSHDGQVSDSAPTATAMTTGVKTKNDIIGLNQTAMYKDCEGSKDKHVTTAFEQAEAAGLATGVVSTARITHATPAATYAHVANRDWEDDSQLKDEKGKGCLDIADQLVNWKAGDGFEVVEGGRIDHAHHNGNAARALEDTIAFDAAIKTALDKTKREDTLILVTADHSHTMAINGYPKRGNPILGVAVDVDGEVMKGADGIPYTTISYANGPGAVFKPLAEGQTAPEPAGVRVDPSTVDTKSVDYVQQSIVPMASETHAGDDVAIYAWGPQAHLMQGTVEENYIYHLIAHAMGLKPAM